MIHRLKYFLIFVVSIQLRAQSVGGSTSGSVAFCDTINSGFISLSGYVGVIQHWEFSVNNGINWTHISNPTSTQNYNNLTQTTWYRAIVVNGTFLPDTSTISAITIYQKAFGGTVIGGGSFCLTAPSGTLQLNGNVGAVSFWEYSINNGMSWSIITTTNTALPYAALTQNTLYRVVVQNIASCPSATSTAASFIISQNTIVGTLQKSDTVCNGVNADTIRLTGQLGDVTKWIKSTNSGITWTSIANTNTILPYLNITQTTLFAVVVKSGACVTDTSLPVNIVVVNANLANAGSDKTITQYESIQLDGTGNGIPEWSPNIQLSNPNTFTPIASPLHTTTYILTLTDQHSCSSTDSVVVKVIVPIPTAITPNGDGVNDYFLIDKIEDYPQNSLLIFNRWGNVVYKEAPYKNSWNGRSNSGHELPDEVYYYVLDYGNGDKSVSGYILIKR